jgi:hypothetical protein
LPKVTDAEVEERLAAIEYAHGSIAHLAPDRNLADELVADRRARPTKQIKSLTQNARLSSRTPLGSAAWG